MNWQHDKNWSDRFIDQITPILGYVFFTKAPLQRDMQEATDLVMLKMQDTRIGVRMRRREHAQYVNDFTIRCSRPNGAQTELDKLVAGYGHYLFYGFQHQHHDALGDWTIIDLNQFRLHYSKQLESKPPGVLPGMLRTNEDGTAFRVFRYSDFPKQMVVATGPNWDFWQASKTTAA